MKQLPKATALVALDGTVVDASDSWLDVFGVNPKDCSEVNIFHLYGESGLLKQKLQESKSFSFRHGIENKMEENWFESTFAPWFDEKENVIGSIIQTDDISREVEKEMELEKTNNILKIKSEVSQVGCWEYTLATEELFWCDETKKIHNVPLSYKPNVADAIAFYKQGYSRNKISMLFHSAINEGTPFNKKLTIITQNGEEKWVSAAGKPIRENGKIVKLLGTFQDINEQVTSETRIKHHQKLLTALIDNLPLNVFVKDLDSRKILVNKAECEYLGKSTKELIGKTDFDLYEKEVAKISREEDLEVIRTLKPMLGKETISIKKDGKITNFLTSKIPLFDLEGKISGLIGIGLDITAMKKKEDQLRNLINITSVQNKKLINFAHIVSHNLRSHSANFSMLLKFLSEEQNEAEKTHIMNMLNQASDSLLETLENLNQVVDINTNVTLSKQPLNLNESIDKVRKNLSAFLEKNKVKIINNIPQDMIVWSVPAYLDSIILNLVTNAVKYSSPERSPIITMDAKKRDKTLIFSVSDNGLGIDLERYGDKIFGMYKTFHNRKDAKGIGLYIIKNQIEAMGGSITVNSEVDKGATFNVYFNEESK
ncbi:PAS domain-containing sensor histidine kinase [Flagellimonas taeanensis]|uniref:PAS domain-containing sensor histidine kinase n=1 Tax=Flagellimonas taeanensis TaxID=1005926 RepID=UPI0009351AE9|nr:PAS domain-containing protein [Allomuricauda taeanensis]MEE1962476.1 PAS domain-containing protein [Allomuricauda taeanensis]